MEVRRERFVHDTAGDPYHDLTEWVHRVGWSYRHAASVEELGILDLLPFSADVPHGVRSHVRAIYGPEAWWIHNAGVEGAKVRFHLDMTRTVCELLATWLQWKVAPAHLDPASTFTTLPGPAMLSEDSKVGRRHLLQARFDPMLRVPLKCFLLRIDVIGIVVKITLPCTVFTCTTQSPCVPR